MTRWLIKIANQPPVTVEVDDARNLTNEFETFRRQRRSVWEWLTRAPRHWQVTEKVSLHPEIILSIEALPRPKRSAPRKVIGFHSPA